MRHGTIEHLAAKLATGKTTSRQLVEECLSRIDDPAGEGRRAFLSVSREKALAAADYYDRLRGPGAAPTAFAGIPISIKDLFDMAGETTTAGSIVLRDAPPATRDAGSVARLKAAGFVPVGRTNMSEFAFSGLGLNPHYDTPRTPYDRATGRLPGGSSSGAAVSVADGMAFGALGTDTGGSCRIPAALCGIVGFKPTAHRVPQSGVFPLAPSLDSVGPLAGSVRSCAILDAVLAGDDPDDFPDVPLDGLRLGLPQTLVMDGLDPAVAGAFSKAMTRLSHSGARIMETPLRELAELPRLNEKGGFFTAEAYAHHRSLVDAKAALYDQRILSRIRLGANQSAADYLDLLHRRADFITRVEPVMAPYDALIMPTVPIVPPALAPLEDEQEYHRVNLLLLRNTRFANLLDGSAVSIPCHEPGQAPVGLMIVGPRDSDRRLLGLAAAIEALVSPTAAR